MWASHSAKKESRNRNNYTFIHNCIHKILIFHRFFVKISFYFKFSSSLLGEQNFPKSYCLLHFCEYLAKFRVVSTLSNLYKKIALPPSWWLGCFFCTCNFGTCNVTFANYFLDCITKINGFLLVFLRIKTRNIIVFS